MKILLLSAVLLTGCVTTQSTVIPKANGQYDVIGTSGNSESAAFEAAIEEGKNYCGTDGREFAMVSQRTRTRGMNKKTETAVNVAGRVIKNSQEDGSTDGASRSQRTQAAIQETLAGTETYEVTVSFVCRNRE